MTVHMMVRFAVGAMVDFVRVVVCFDVEDGTVEFDTAAGNYCIPAAEPAGIVVGAADELGSENIDRPVEIAQPDLHVLVARAFGIERIDKIHGDTVVAGREDHTCSGGIAGLADAAAVGSDEPAGIAEDLDTVDIVDTAEAAGLVDPTA